MYKGWKGFLFVGQFFFPLIMIGWYSWYLFHIDNSKGGIMGVIACSYLLVAFSHALSANTWQIISGLWRDLNNCYKALNDEILAFVNEKNLTDELNKRLEQKQLVREKK